MSGAAPRFNLFCIIAGLLLLWGMGWIAMTHPRMPFPYNGFDEQGHASYTAHLMQRQRWFPDFKDFHMMEPPQMEQETEEPNYINHPPLFYWLMEASQRILPDLQGNKARLPSFLLYAIAMGLYGYAGLRSRFSPLVGLAYMLVPVALLVPQSTVFYNNDSLGFLGGSLIIFASSRLLKSEQADGTSATLLGLGILCASTKLNAFLLCGIFCLTLAPQLFSRFRRTPWLMLWTGLFAAAALAPYLYFLWAYGSPVPSTEGQIHLLQTHSALLGWDAQPRLSFLAYTAHALWDLVAWAPIAAPVYATMVLTLTFCLFRQAMIPLGKKPGQETNILIARAASVATVITLIIHLAFSYQRHLQFGWLGDWYLRYYFPLIGAYALSFGNQWENIRNR